MTAQILYLTRTDEPRDGDRYTTYQRTTDGLLWVLLADRDNK